MNVLRCVVVTLLLVATGVPARAQSSIDVASTCLTDHTSGRDRKVFVKWVFIAMAKHPEIANLAAIDIDTEDAVNNEVGALVTRLLTDDCAPELRAMIKENGPKSLGKAFEVFGRVAMLELMSDAQVGAAMSGLDQYTDRQRIQDALRVD